MPFHESTRRRICRIAFVAICVVPTAAVLVWATYANSPQRATDFEQDLAAALELSVEVDELSYPRPGTVAYQGIVLVDTETRRVVAEIDQAEATRHAEGIVLTLPHAELDATLIDRLWRATDRQLRVRRAASALPLRIAVERLTLHGEGTTAITLAQVGAQLSAAEDATRAGLRFSLPPDSSTPKPAEPVQFVLERSHGKDPSTAKLELRTGGAPLPLTTLTAIFPALQNLGDRASFTGQLWATRSGDKGQWSGELTGRLNNVDLDSLITRNFPHKLSGEAEITLHKLAFTAGRATRITGRLSAGPGVVGKSLLTAANQHLALRTAAETDASDLIKYEHLAFSFDLAADHLTIQGESPASKTDKSARDNTLCILRDQYGPLLSQADRQPQPALGLVRTLVPQSETLVPATAETDLLLRSLHQPSVSTNSANTPSAKLRDAATGD